MSRFESPGRGEGLGMPAGPPSRNCESRLLESERSNTGKRSACGHRSPLARGNESGAESSPGPQRRASFGGTISGRSWLSWALVVGSVAGMLWHFAVADRLHRIMQRRNRAQSASEQDRSARGVARLISHATPSVGAPPRHHAGPRWQLGRLGTDPSFTCERQPWKDSDGGAVGADRHLKSGSRAEPGPAVDDG